MTFLQYAEKTAPYAGVGLPFYTAFDYNENPVSVEFYRPILNQDRSELIDRLAPNGKLQLQDLMYQAFNNYIAWPDNALKDIYKRVYGL